MPFLNIFFNESIIHYFPSRWIMNYVNKMRCNLGCPKRSCVKREEPPMMRTLPFCPYEIEVLLNWASLKKIWQKLCRKFLHSYYPLYNFTLWCLHILSFAIASKHSGRTRTHKKSRQFPLVPKDDPTTLFTGSGMQQLVPYLLGDIHPLGNRLYNIQRGLRTQDIEEVGDNRPRLYLKWWAIGL